jgi:outer membrane protein TolC
MDRAPCPFSRAGRRARWLIRGAFAVGAPLLALGCGRTLFPSLDNQGVTTVRFAQPSEQTPNEIVRASHTTQLPPPVPLPATAAGRKEVPITLDAVLRLAEGQNPRIALAREKLAESQHAGECACSAWMPQAYAGIAYYRHEGGIQNEDGTLTHSSTGAVFPGVQLQTSWDLRERTFQRIDAERKGWQSKGELSQVTNEVLLDAATTYIDLLTARRGEAITREMEASERKLLAWAEKLAKADPANEVALEGVRTQLAARAHIRSQLRQQGNAAAAKLVYLLGLPPDVELVPVDATLVPVDLVDVTPPVGDLVSQALTTGPGVQELEGLLRVIQGGMDEMSGPRMLLPSFRLNVYEGAFGAGAGDSMKWDNRLDVCAQARWDLTQLLTGRAQRRAAESKLTQARLSYDDLRGKLAAGVKESRDAILSGREQVGAATQQLDQASKGYRLSDLRLEKSAPGSSVAEVMRSLRGVDQAHLNYLTSVSSHNKAQVRLLLLLGRPGPVAPAPHHGQTRHQHGH